MISTLMAQVDGRRLIKTVEGIVTGERLSNAAERRALDYMKAEYEAAGCVAHFEEHLGYVSTPEKASLTVAGESVDCVTHAMTPSCSGLAAPMTYLSHKDFKGFGPAEVAGMIVLTDGLALEPKVRALQEAGAAGVVFITGQFTHTMIVSRVWGSPTPETMDKYVKIPVVSISYADGQALKAKAAGKPEAVMSTEVWARWTMMPCLVADIPGRTDDFVIMTSHIDSWWLGAFDNASGNAAGIEVARILAPHKDKLVRGVRFINWSGHSQGRYAGSAQYCDFHFEELSEHCVLNVNADCLGGKGATVMTYSPSMACNKGLAMTALSEAAGVTGYEGHRYSRSCDMSFWGPGVPAMYCQVSEQPPVKGAAADAFSALFGGESKTGGFGYWWHTKEDTIDKVDPDVLARDVKVFVSTVWHACADETLPLSAAAEAAELVADIEAWDAMASGAGRPVDLGLAKARAAELAAALAKLDADAASGAVPVCKRNRLVSAALRKIIPLGYVKGSIYRHDDAVRSPAMPMLQAIEDLAAATDQHMINCLTISIRRDVNRLCDGLKQALALLA